MKRSLSLIIALSLISFCSKAQIRQSLWSVPGITHVPEYSRVLKDSVFEIIYSGLPYKGSTKRTFAYYATPGSLRGETDTGHSLPAVVLVHGGGGTAFIGWVKEWARRGYAAIAMDTRGNYPDGRHLPQGFQETASGTPVYDVSLPLDEQWFFQAIADIIFAHSLVRSFPEIDTNRTALAGISWGSVLSLVAASVDQRFKATASIYGCGFFPTSPMLGEGLNSLSPGDKKLWLNQYDPANYVSYITHPVLFINGTNDPAFYLSPLIATASLVKHKQFSIQPGLQHGHYTNGMGYEIKEHYAFISQHLQNGEGLAHFTTEKKRGNRLIAKMKYDARPVSARLMYTADTSSDEQKRKWQSIPVPVRGNTLRSGIVPAHTVMCFLSVTDERGLQSSGRIYSAAMLSKEHFSSEVTSLPQ